MVGVWKIGPTEVGMRVIMLQVKSMVTAVISGQMEAPTQEDGKKTRSTERANMSGWTGEVMKGIGLKIIWMVMESMLGVTVESMKVLIQKIRSMDLEPIHGLMVESILECGKTAVSTVRVNTNLVQLKILRRDYGSTENVKNGFERF